MNRKIEWIINQNWDEQTEPLIKLRYADAAPVKRTPMNRLDLITFLDELIRIDTLRPITTSNIASQTVNKAKYATDGVAVGTPALRNQYFASAEATPTVNGQICWVYG